MENFKQFDDKEKDKGSGKEALKETAVAETDDSSDDDYRKICYVCRRPESKTGATIEMPGGMCLCHDRMQKIFDSVTKSGMDFSQIRNMPYMNLNFDDFSNLNTPGMTIPEKQKVKEESAEDRNPAFDVRDTPAPHKTKARLNEYVIGREQAKKVISMTVYNHYRQVFSPMNEEKQEDDDDVRIEKPNTLMVGPTGNGKTSLVKTLAKLLNVPLTIADATSLTGAGYIGDNAESAVSRLLAAADNDMKKVGRGVIFIGGIDKVTKKKDTSTRDISGKSVQQELLKLLEGNQVEVPVGSNQRNVLTLMTTVNTDNILLACDGAFPDLEKIIKERLLKKSSIGFNTDLKDRYEEESDILTYVTNQDLRTFDMIPEFLGRLPIIVTFRRLTQELVVETLKKPKNAILKQYIKLLALGKVRLVLEDDALNWIAGEALKRETGAKVLRTIIENFMLDIMYEIPKDSCIDTVIITKVYLGKNGGPLIGMRGGA